MHSRNVNFHCNLETLLLFFVCFLLKYKFTKKDFLWVWIFSWKTNCLKTKSYKIVEILNWIILKVVNFCWMQAKLKCSLFLENIILNKTDFCFICWKAKLKMLEKILEFILYPALNCICQSLKSDSYLKYTPSVSRQRTFIIVMLIYTDGPGKTSWRREEKIKGKLKKKQKTNPSQFWFVRKIQLD